MWDGTNVVSLGTYPSGEERSARFKIRNAGTGPLKLGGVVLTCGCLRVDACPGEVAAGAVGEVAVTVKRNEVEGDFKIVFYVRTDDPCARLVRAEVRGHARPPFQVTCDTATELGTVEEGQVWTGRYTVVATEAGLSLGEPAETNRGTRSVSRVTANGGGRASYAVERVVTFTGRGFLESELSFPVVGAACTNALPVRLSVAGVRRPYLRVVPNRMLVGVEKTEVLRRFLVLVDSGGRTPDSKRLSVASPLPGFDARPVLSKNGNGFLVEVRLGKDGTDALKKAGLSEVAFRYGDGETIPIPVRCE